MNYVYPVVFSKEDDGFCVYAPDLPGCVTEAGSYAEGIEKIRDGICGMLYILERDKMQIPAASAPNAVEHETGDAVALVDANLLDYKRRIGSKAVRRTISIPAYLDDMASRAGVSLSQVTQDALRSMHLR
jgi:predicted RNase H-like HicB family nuclease